MVGTNNPAVSKASGFRGADSRPPMAARIVEGSWTVTGPGDNDSLVSNHSVVTLG